MVRRAWLSSCVVLACSFDSGGQATGGASIGDAGSSSSTMSDPGSNADPSTTTVDAATSAADPSAADTLGDLDTSTGQGVTATTDSSTSGVEPAIETCNGVDDDGDGAIDEYSRQNASCADCTYQITPIGVVQSYCVEPVSWETALDRCALLGASLATLHSAEENTEVFQATAGSTAWIGLTDAALEGTWVWHDASAPDFTAWGPGQPNDVENEDCAHTQESGDTWNDDQCELLHGFVCRGPP